MPEIKVQDAEFKPKSIDDFIIHLRRISKISILTSGCYMLWEVFKRPELKEHDETTVLSAYGTKTILYALACCNDYRHVKASPEDFFELCASYLQLPIPLSDEVFSLAESAQLDMYLKDNSICPALSRAGIPFANIHTGYKHAFVARGMTIQHRTYHAGIEDLYRDFHLIKTLNDLSSGLVNQILVEEFSQPPTQLYRAVWGIFSLALAASPIGFLNLESITITDDVRKSLSLNEDFVREFAKQISCQDTSLRTTWLNDIVFKLPELYQAHAPDPLYQCSLIALTSKGEHFYLIPDPLVYLQSFRHVFFSKLFGLKNFGNLLGVAIEDHIHKVLRHIFHDRVSKITAVGKHADFIISLDKINIIIEVKTSLGSLSSNTIMMPLDLAQMWERLHNACVQCSSSLQHIDNSKMNICFIVTADTMITQYWPFHIMCQESGIYEQLSISAIEYLAWSGFERLLSETSIDNFENALFEKWSQPNAITFDSLNIQRGDAAHSYEFFEVEQKELFPHRFD